MYRWGLDDHGGDKSITTAIHDPGGNMVALDRLAGPVVYDLPLNIEISAYLFLTWHVQKNSSHVLPVLIPGMRSALPWKHINE